MACGICGDNVVSSTCTNPCGITAGVNTAECESLPSQIENFTTHFFGAVEKTEVNGVVEWTLPCELEVGLENNPRQNGEGLACYFLRLFREGILGAQGPTGEPGEDGVAGRNAYTVTLASFAQPTLASPYVQVTTSYNPCILVGMNVFIATSGEYEVTATSVNGDIWLTLTDPLGSAPAVITAGKLVVPTGHPGTSVVGPAGPAGPQGPQGTPGASYTADNQFYYADMGANYNIPLAPYNQVTFVTSHPEVTVNEGVWMVTANIEIRPAVTIATTDKIRVKLRDITAATDLPGALRETGNLTVDSVVNIAISVRYTAPANGTTIALFAEMDNANRAYFEPTGVQIMAVKLSD